MKVLLLAFAILAATEARRFCQVDDDCMDLGDITCQYSRCESWGICGCPRGYAVRFMGSELKFQCLLLKKLGESCSEDGQNGVCGPDQSFCDKGRCRCGTNLVEAWDGEKCLTQYELSQHYGETCSDSLGTCGSASGTCTKGVFFDRAGHDYEMPICACPTGQRLVIPNAFAASPFVGRREPSCQDIGLGDQCMFNGDCTANNGNSECVNNVCVCITGYVESGEQGCRDSTVWTLLAQGAICDPKNNGGTAIAANSICGKNMMCGDICVPDEFNDNTEYDFKCTCKTGYSGSNCDPVGDGTACSGDWMCQGFAYDALCLEGVCTAGASGITFSLLTMLFMVVAHYL